MYDVWRWLLKTDLFAFRLRVLLDQTFFDLPLVLPAHYVTPPPLQQELLYDATLFWFIILCEPDRGFVENDKKKRIFDETSQNFRGIYILVQ